MPESTRFDLLVVGGGPAGYVGAIRAARLGMKTALVERDRPGGVCLNWGCIPTKSLIHQAEIFSRIPALESMGIKVERDGFDYARVFKKSRAAADRLSRGVQALLKKNGIEWIHGTGRFEGKDTVVVNEKDRVRADRVLIATGSRPKALPGLSIDEKNVLSSTGALSLEVLPKSIAVLGAGAVGVEFAYIFNRFGVKVVLVEMEERILPLEDPECVSVLAKDFRKNKIDARTATRFSGAAFRDGAFDIRLENAEGETTVRVEKILCAAGRLPNTGEIGLDHLGIETEKGFVPVGDHYRTPADGVYAAGDVIDTPLLAHLASREALIAVEHMAGLNPPARVPAACVPSAVYTEPQVASFGARERELEQSGAPFEKTVFPYRGVGKAIVAEAPEGMVKLLVHRDTKEILGAHLAGKDATELVHELLLAKSAELLPEDVSETVHAHPTLSEVVMEAAHAAEGKAIHM